MDSYRLWYELRVLLLRHGSSTLMVVIDKQVIELYILGLKNQLDLRPNPRPSLYTEHARLESPTCGKLLGRHAAVDR